MPKIKSEVRTQRSLSSPPTDLPDDADHIYNADDKHGCSLFQSCVQSNIATFSKVHIHVPAVTSDILIDSEGYRLEAKLLTFEHVQYEDGCSEYNKHVFTDVNINGPAGEMEIKDDDEIVITTFVPEKTHNDVLQLFKDISVGGQSQLKMVIRRVKPRRRCVGLKWKWLELTATFTLHREIDGLYKTTSVRQNSNGGYVFSVTLCDPTQTWFIAVDRRGRISLIRKRDWFNFRKRGSGAIFQTKHGHYLAYDQENDRVRTQAREYVLEEIVLWQQSSLAGFRR